MLTKDARGDTELGAGAWFAVVVLLCTRGLPGSLHSDYPLIWKHQPILGASSVSSCQVLDQAV